MRFNSLNRPLSKGIRHIEDLSIEQFIHSLRKFDEYEISEKLDGSNLEFGIDEQGFYTSRESKGGNRMYNVDQYPINFITTFQRAAHKALEKVMPALLSAGLSNGDKVESEILFGKLPNVVPYSSEINSIIFIQVIDGDVDLDRLRDALDGETVTVVLPAPLTADGKSVHIDMEEYEWNFKKNPVYSVSDLVNSDVKGQINIELDNLEDYLKSPSGIREFTNFDILSMPLNKRPAGIEPIEWRELKAHIKRAREEESRHIYAETDQGRTGFKSRIKDLLLNNLVRQIKSEFGPTTEDGGWIEGVVFQNKETGDMFKVVDKDMFTTVKNFMWEVRTGLTNKPKSINNIESFIGTVLNKLSSSLGHPELGTTQAKRYLKKQGIDKNDILLNISEGINFQSVQQYWLNVIDEKEAELTELLDQYSNEKGNKQLVANFGDRKRMFTYDDEIDKRTLQVFASMFGQLRNFKKRTQTATMTEDLIKLLVGRQLGNI